MAGVSFCGIANVGRKSDKNDFTPFFHDGNRTNGKRDSLVITHFDSSPNQRLIQVYPEFFQILFINHNPI